MVETLVAETVGDCVSLGMARISTAASLSMCSGVPLRFPGLQNRERFKNVVFSSSLPPGSACARGGVRYASLVCTTESF
jgi:hypothetical protein